MIKEKSSEVSREAQTWLVVGLGNPGSRYARHRHNVGFHFIDALKDKCRELNLLQDKPRYTLWRGMLPHSESVSQSRKGVFYRVLLMKPLTFMNLSGPPVGHVAHFYKIPLQNILVVHDELALQLGQVRFKKGGGAAGHNGLKSLDGVLGQGYCRLRIGIGHPGLKEAVTGHVLGNFTQDESQEISALAERMCSLFSLLLQGNSSLFTTKLALLKDVPPS